MQLYISNEIRSVTGNAFEVLQLRSKVKAGDVIRGSDLTEAEVPAAFEKAFERALRAHERSLVINQRAPRNMNEGEVLYAPDFKVDTAESLHDIIDVRKGYELVSIPVDKDTSVGGQLQPGSYVTIRGIFEESPDDKKEDLEVVTVLNNVRVATVDGSAQVLPAARRGKYDRIGVELKPDQADLLLELLLKEHRKRFQITLPPQPDVDLKVEPKINQDVVRKYLGRDAGTIPGALFP
jgi:Flp pilus assembly protein CpaB